MKIEINQRQLNNLREALQSENEDNYLSVIHGVRNSAEISSKERLLARLERAVFGKASIQKEAFEKLCKTKPEYKSGLSCYKND